MRPVAPAFFGSGGGQECSWESNVSDNPQVLFYPSGSTNDDPMDSRRDMFPYQYQKWGICALKFSNSAGASGVERLPRHTFGQFQPLDPGNPQALGAYRLWFYEREKYARHTVNDHTPCYEGRC